MYTEAARATSPKSETTSVRHGCHSPCWCGRMKRRASAVAASVAAPQPDVAGRAPLRETDVHEAVVQVLAVRDVHGLPVLEPLGDNERRVDDRHRENEQREEEGHDRRGLQKPLERNRGQHEPEQHRARVAHEDPRGIDVVAQEPERGTEHDRGENRGLDFRPRQ